MTLFPLILFCVVSVATSYAQCQAGYYLNPSVHRCFKVSVSPSTYFSAWKQCGIDGGTLASISNGYVNSFIGGLLSSENYYYIGLNTLATGNWEWIDGTNSTYGNWKDEQHSVNQCGTIQGLSNKWKDQPCNNSYPYVCMTDPVSNSDGTCSNQTSCPSCSPHCESEWTYFSKTNYCYKVVKGTGIAYYQASAACQSFGAQLISIHSKEENNFIGEIASTGIDSDLDSQIWIGLLRKNGNWTWMDGTSMDYEYTWAPNGSPFASPADCGYIIPEDITINKIRSPLTWSNQACNAYQRGYICKKISN